MIKIFFLTFILFGIHSVNAEMNEEQFRQYAEKINKLVEQKNDDPQILLGVAELCDLSEEDYFRPVKGSRVKYDDVIKIDPSNAPAYAELSENAVWRYLRVRKNSNNEIEEVKKLWKGELEIPTNSGLYELTRTEEDRKILAQEQKEAILEHKKEADITLTNVMAMLVEAEQTDPQNALFNYLRAGMFNCHGKVEEALEEIEKGLKKNTFTLYLEDRLKARRRVLEAVEYPWPEAGYMQALRSIEYSSEVSYLREILITEGKKTEGNDPGRAEHLYEMMLSVAEQMGKSLYSIDQRISMLDLRILAYKAMADLYDKAGSKDKAMQARANYREAEKERDIHMSYFPSFKDHTSQKYKEYVKQVVEKGTWRMFQDNEL